MTVSKMIKINLLSLAAIFLYLITFIAKVLEILFRKIYVFLGIALLTLITIGVYETILNWDSILNYIKSTFLSNDSLLALLILFAIGILAITVSIFLLIAMFSFFAATIASVIFIYIWGGLIIFSEKIYLWCYTGYTKLIDICEKDRELIKLSNNKLKITLGCGFYYVAIGLKKLIKLIAQKGIIISVFCSLTAFICYCILLNNYISTKFGTNLIHIFKEIDTLSIVFNIIIGLLVIANIVLLIILLGVGLQSWVSKPNNKPQPNNTNNISEKSIQPNSNPSNPKSNLTININIVVLPNAKSNQTNRLENAQKYKEILKNNVEEKKQLKSKIENLFQTQTNAVLEVYWKEYEQELLRIVNTFNTLCENGQMPISIFERLIPKIKYLDNQRKELEKSIQELKDKYNDPLSQSVFFSDCKTLDEFEKKHKTLCKKYHPDMGNGNNETFIKMQQEYEKYKPYYNYNGS